MREVVGVLRGGSSREYEQSLHSGRAVLAALDPAHYEPRDIFIDRSGEWHLFGAPVPPECALFGIDVAFNALHGGWGQDGRVQRLLAQLAVPHTGAGTLASSLAFDRHKAKEAAAKLGLRVAHGILVLQPTRIEDLAYNLFRTFPQPSVVGGMVANNYHELEHALQSAFLQLPEVLVEEHLHGREASVGVLDHYRGEHPYALIPEPTELFLGSEKKELVRLAKQVHQGLGLAHYSSVEFVVTRRGPYFAGVNTHPELHEESVFHRALNAVGTKLSDFLHHIISLAKKR